jgi:hypothetical protein
LQIENPMKRKLLTCFRAGLSLCAVGVITAQAQNTYITFSVDEATNLVNGTFNPPAPANIGGNSYGGTGSDIVAVRGTFDGWAYPGLQLVQVGSSSVYTNTTDDTSAQDQSDGNVNFIYDDTENGGESPGDYENRMAYLPPGNNASVVLPTPYFNDIGPATTANVKFQVDMSEQIEIGAFHPTSGDLVVVFGSFNGWNATAGGTCILTNDPSILVTNQNFNPAVIESNVWTTTIAVNGNARPSVSYLATPNCAEEYKYIIQPAVSGWSYDSAEYPNADPDTSNNRFFTEGNQTLPLVTFSDIAYAPLANVTLNVDMSAVAMYDTNFVPNSVTAWGSFNGWSGPVTMNNSLTASNTNLYSATVSMGEGAQFILQYRYTNSLTGGWVFDYAQDGGPNTVNNNAYRRLIEYPITPTVLNTNIPPVYFNDLAPDDLLPVATPVLFSVDMTGAVQTNGQPFAPGSDGIYINGMFAGAAPSIPVGGTAQAWYPWSGGANLGGAPGGFAMAQVGSSTIYTNTIIMPAGTPVALSYQYGIDPQSLYGGPEENEAPPSSVHYRVIRSTISSPYVMPTDTFSSQPYVEPFFSTGNIGANGSLAGGNLTVGMPVAGKVPVTWLGRPGAHLQAATNLLSGTWQNLVATDGTSWTTVTSSTNGLVSQTNWPASTKAFFRLVKP